MDTINFAKTYWDERVSILLGQLSQYEQIERDLEIGTKDVGVRQGAFSFGEGKRGRIQNLSTKVALTREDRGSLKEEQILLGNAMKYDNPYVWIKYKGLAYFNHPNQRKKMNTLHDFVVHMSFVEETICPKRFDMTNRALRKLGLPDLTQGLIPLDTSLRDIADHPEIIKLCLDADFIRVWCAHEYDAHGKWVHYEPDGKNFGAAETRCC